MRSRLFLTWAALRWLVLMFVVVGTAKAPAVAKPSEPLRPIRAWEGKASWYGQKFHGRLTANGERFDMNGPTAAHRTLPMGSIVRLVNPKTGKARYVRINDRGPFIEGREIDVSYQVARSLGFENQGLARVRIELIQVPERKWSTRRAND